MSNVPHYLPSSRSGTALGHAKLIDGVIYDGLWDPYDDGESIPSMPAFSHQCKQYWSSRKIIAAEESYRRAREAMALGVFEDKIVAMEGRKEPGGDLLDTIGANEEPDSVGLDRLPSSRPVFEKDGTVTAGNASFINDGAAAMLIMDEACAVFDGLVPLARISGYADAEGPPVPVRFATAPSLAVILHFPSRYCTSSPCLPSNRSQWMNLAEYNLSRTV